MRIRAPGFRLGSGYHVAFSDCSRFLATVGRRVTLWDVAGRVALHRNNLLRHPSSLAFAPDGASYVVKSTSGELLVCTTAHGDPISRYRPRPPAEGARIMFSGDGQHLLDGSWDGRIAMRRVEGLDELLAETFPQTMVSMLPRAAIARCGLSRYNRSRTIRNVGPAAGLSCGAGAGNRLSVYSRHAGSLISTVQV